MTAVANEVVQFAHCRVEIYDPVEYLETIFDDGSKVGAQANHDAENEARAHSLGYLNTWEMSREHEILHSALSTARGFRWCPVLHAVATGEAEKLNPEIVASEEALVLCVQRLLNDARGRVAVTGDELRGPIEMLTNDEPSQMRVRMHEPR